MQRIVAKAVWKRHVKADFTDFLSRPDVEPVVHIASPHGCDEAVLLAFVVDEPEEERDRAIQFYQDQMTYHCICGKGKFASQESLLDFIASL